MNQPFFGVQMEKEKQRLLRKLSEKQHEYDAAASRYESAANSVRTRLAHVRSILSASARDYAYCNHRRLNKLYPNGSGQPPTSGLRVKRTTKCR
jgi:hypothetical protein